MKALLLGDRRLQLLDNDHDTLDGTCIRHCINANDVGDEHAKVLEYLADSEPTVEVNEITRTGLSVLDFIPPTEQLTDDSVPFDIVARCPEDPVTRFADPTFAEQTLRRRAQYRLDESIQTDFDWNSSQR